MQVNLWRINPEELPLNLTCHQLTQIKELGMGCICIGSKCCGDWLRQGYEDIHRFKRREKKHFWCYHSLFIATYLWNWSWKRSRCPCRVSAGRPEMNDMAHTWKWLKCQNINMCWIMSNNHPYRHAAWKAAWRQSGTGDCSPGWPGWVEPGDTGLMWDWKWRWTCWAVGALMEKKLRGSVCV